jgi:hypothetical protein
LGQPDLRERGRRGEEGGGGRGMKTRPCGHLQVGRPPFNKKKHFHPTHTPPPSTHKPITCPTPTIRTGHFIHGLRRSLHDRSRGGGKGLGHHVTKAREEALGKLHEPRRTRLHRGGLDVLEHLKQDAKAHQGILLVVVGEALQHHPHQLPCLRFHGLRRRQSTDDVQGCVTDPGGGRRGEEGLRQVSTRVRHPTEAFTRTTPHPNPTRMWKVGEWCVSVRLCVSVCVPLCCEPTGKSDTK